MGVLGAIPSTYTDQTASARSFFIQKGQLNKYRMRSAILNEHAESSREVQATVADGNHVGQIFRASQDNINGINLTMGSAAGTVFEDFESYADDTALQAAWVETDPADAAVLSANVPSGGGSQSMQLDGSATVGDEWVKTITATDYSENSIDFSAYQDREYSTLKFRVFVGDGVNTKSQSIVLQAPNDWEHFNIALSDMTEDGGGTTDEENITKVGFRLEDRRTASLFYVDSITTVPIGGLVNVELWDMGKDFPVDGVTSLDDGSQYLELGDRGINSGVVVSSVPVNLLGGVRKYLIRDFVAGVALEIPSNTLLNTGNYYAIVIKYVNTDVDVYGPDTSFGNNYYKSGYAFTTSGNSAPISKIGVFSDLQFVIYSTQDCFLNTLVKFYDAVPGVNATETANIEDENMVLTGIIKGTSKPQQAITAEFKDRVFHFPKGGKFEVNHTDDPADNTSQITLVTGYIYEPQPTYITGELLS